MNNSPVSDDILRGCPQQMPCAWCKGSRADQVRTTYYATSGYDTPLCKSCWAKEYGSGIHLGEAIE